MVAILNSLFRQPQGYLRIEDPDPTKSKGQRAVSEYVTQTCRHCGALVKVDLRAPEPNMERCYGCNANICLKCSAERLQTMRCDVIERKLERWEASKSLMRALK